MGFFSELIVPVDQHASSERVFTGVVGLATAETRWDGFEAVNFSCVATDGFGSRLWADLLWGCCGSSFLLVSLLSRLLQGQLTNLHKSTDRRTLRGTVCQDFLHLPIVVLLNGFYPTELVLVDVFEVWQLAHFRWLRSVRRLAQLFGIACLYFWFLRREGYNRLIQLQTTGHITNLLLSHLRLFLIRSFRVSTRTVLFAGLWNVAFFLVLKSASLAESDRFRSSSFSEITDSKVVRLSSVAEGSFCPNLPPWEQLVSLQVQDNLHRRFRFRLHRLFLLRSLQQFGWVGFQNNSGRTGVTL